MLTIEAERRESWELRQNAKQIEQNILQSGVDLMTFSQLILQLDLYVFGVIVNQNYNPLIVAC